MFPYAIFFRTLINPFDRLPRFGFTVTKTVSKEMKGDFEESLKNYFGIHSVTKADMKEIKDNKEFLITDIGLTEENLSAFIGKA